MGRARTACRTCAAIKTVCSREAPCARCRRLSLACSLLDSPSALSALSALSVAYTVPGPPAARSRVRSSRSSHGCAACRRRRKKCDEKRPTCGDCRRLGLACRPRGHDAHDHDHDQTQTEVAKTPSLPDDAESSEPAHVISTATDSLDWVAVIAEERLSESAKVARLLGTLAHSSALDVLPEARASDLEPPDLRTQAVLLPSNALSNRTGITPDRLASWTVGERHLLNHFLQSVARALVMVRSDADNPFLRSVVPLALASDGDGLVRHALAALSACHLAQVYPDFERNLLVHRSRALEALQADIDRGEATVAALTATLLLCLTEICEGSSRKWLLYLYGARALLTSLVPLDGGDLDRAAQPELAFLADLYDYLACIASFSSPHVFAPLPVSLSFSSSSSSTSTNPIIHPLFGLAAPLYGCLARTNRLVARQDAGTIAPAAFRREARAIDLDLQSWHPPEEDADTDADTAPDMLEARAAAFAVQWAAILRLRQVAPIESPPSCSSASPSSLQGPADHILSALSLIRPGSHTQAHMLLPLFMAGVGSVSKASRLTVEHRISIIQRTVGLGNIGCAHRLLNELWRRRNSGDMVAWEALAKDVCPGLVLF